jgi:hypothetical protein
MAVYIPTDIKLKLTSTAVMQDITIVEPSIAEELRSGHAVISL